MTLIHPAPRILAAWAEVLAEAPLAGGMAPTVAPRERP
jgi:hypothetical protein